VDSRVNLLGVVHGIRTFLPIMIRQGEDAHIVNTASFAGLITGGSLYGATKSAVIALSETVYLELVTGGYKPRISVLCPGIVATNIYDCDRHRPAKYGHAGPTPPGWDKKAARESFKRGLDPRAVGEQVLAAIRQQRFYIFTQLEYPRYAKHIRHRMEQLLNAENPTMLPWEA
jgi:short-subunit dehydrogenase